MNAVFSTSTPLLPPEGYQPGSIARYPTRALNIIATVLSLVLLPLLGALIWELQRRSPTPGAITFTMPDSAIALAAALLTIVLHELLHGVVLRACGYCVSFGVAWRLLVAYAAAFGQLQRRNHALLNALAPFVIITAAMLPLLAMPNHLAIVVAFVALLTNTAGAVADLYLAWRLLRLPHRTLLYDVDPTQMVIFLPSR